MISYEVMKQFQEANEFLEDHPAFACGGITPLHVKKFNPYHKPCSPVSLTMIVNVCEKGYSLDGVPPLIEVYPDNPRYEELKSRVGERALSRGLTKGIQYRSFMLLEEDKKEHLVVDYQIYFGVEWKAKGIEVWLRTGRRRFIKTCSWSKEPRWESWLDEDLSVGAKTYEEAIIELAKKVKLCYGDFNQENILPEWIENYNRSIYEINDKIYGSGVDGMMKMINDNNSPRTIHLSDAEINEIWWQKHEVKRMKEIYPNRESDIVDKYLDVSLYLDEKKFNRKFSKILKQYND